MAGTSVVNDASLVEDVTQEEDQVVLADDDVTQMDETLESQHTDSIFVPPQTVRKRRVGKLAKVEQALTKLQKIAENRPTTSSSNKNLDEYDLFAQHIASQMRQLPVRSFILLQEKFQSLITKERLTAMQSPSPILSGGSSCYDERTDDDLSEYSHSVIQDGSRIYAELF